MLHCIPELAVTGVVGESHLMILHDGCEQVNVAADMWIYCCPFSLSQSPPADLTCLHPIPWNLQSSD